MKTFVWILFIAIFVASFYADVNYSESINWLSVILRGLILYAFANRTCYFIEARKKFKDEGIDDDE